MDNQPSLASSALHCHWQGQGQPLILLHGWGMNGAVWQGITPQLVALGFRVGQVDLPGFGHSAPLPPGAGLAGIADAVADLLPHQHSQEPAHVMGWSLGGLVATQLALDHPSKIASLVTLASSPCFEAESGWPGIKPEVLKQFASQLELDLPRTLDRFFALQAMGSPSARDDVRALRQAVAERPGPHPRTLAEGLALLSQCDLRQRLPELSLPWLRLYGRLDGLVPRRVITLVDELAPVSRAEVMAKASHAPFISHPAESLQTMKSFYDSL